MSYLVKPLQDQITRTARCPTRYSQHGIAGDFVTQQTPCGWFQFDTSTCLAIGSS
jgi:hypothetical protein